MAVRGNAIRQILFWVAFLSCLIALDNSPFAGQGQPATGVDAARDAVVASAPLTEGQDFCRGGTVRGGGSALSDDVNQGDLQAAVDENAATFVTQSCAADRWFEITFPGARRWVNHVQIQYAGSEDFGFELYDAQGKRQDFVVVASTDEAGDGSSTIRTLRIEPTRVHTIRLVGLSNADPSETVDVFEIAAWYYQTDPDKGADLGNDDAQNWLLCEGGDPVMSPPDLTPLWNRISTRPGWCPGGSHSCHLWLPNSDWAADFTNAANGGAEFSHAWPYTGMDYHDLSVLANHGSPCNITFNNGPLPSNNVLTAPQDVMTSWGDRDAEWFCALSCSPYAFPCAWDWAWGFNDLHLQCGFTTVAWSTGGSFLGTFAWLMTNSFIPLPVASSWFLSKAVWQPSTCVIALADDTRAYSDHLWGYGYVSPDPSTVGTLRGWVYAIFDPPFSVKELAGKEYPPPLTPAQAQSIASISSGPSSKRLPAVSAKGMPVKTTPEVYNLHLQDNITVYTLETLPIDESFIASEASNLCVSNSILCNPVIDQDSNGVWWAIDGSNALWGDPENGVMQLVNVDEFVMPKESAPMVPDPSSAQAATDWTLAVLGLPVGDASVSYSYNAQAAYDVDGDTLCVDSSWDLSMNVDYRRTVGQYPVFGPGGSMSFTWSENEGAILQHFTRGGWHNLVSPVTEELITVAAAIDLIAAQGQEATVGGISPICDTLVIDSVDLAYYETGGDWDTDILEPIYKLTCYAQSQIDTVACDVYVSARLNLLRGSIDQPAHGDVFYLGQDVTLTGSATGGTPQYEYLWYSDIDGYLGGGASLTLSTLSPVYKDTIVTGNPISLTVTDQGGHKAVSRIVLNILNQAAPCVCRPGDPNNDGVTNLADAVNLIGYIFKGGSPPMPYRTCSGDPNADCAVNLADAVYIINYVFKGGPAPLTCEQWRDGHAGNPAGCGPLQ